MINEASETEVIGQNLKALRTLYGYSQRQVAQVLDTSFQQVQKYEKGQNRIPAEKLYRLQSFFEVPYDRFFEGLPAASHEDRHSTARMIKILTTRFQQMEDPMQRQKLFKAFMIMTH